MTKRILLINNYDSFTFNLQHLILEVSNAYTLDVKRNDEPFLTDLESGVYDGVVIGPGPGSPLDDDYFGHNKTVIQSFGTQGLPILGICLGFQGIYNCFGGALQVAKIPMHGTTSALHIQHNGTILKSIKTGVNVMRYHSLIADVHLGIPDCLLPLAYADDARSNHINGAELMAIEHVEHPIYGLQFHPESFATEQRTHYITNFLSCC
ncbi:MAG: aminodeoxychorismate/anthranilate synthase component II [Gammaproteobacteria bacterium]